MSRASSASRWLGISPIFWIGVAITVLLILGLRYTTVGRRFQVVGANPVSSQVMGVRVMLNQIMVYVVASMFYAIAGIALAALLRNPGVNIGSPYLLGPIAAVVIGGASLAGGLASPLATFAAAIFLTGLNQMLRSLGLATGSSRGSSRSCDFAETATAVIRRVSPARSKHEREPGGAQRLTG